MIESINAVSYLLAFGAGVISFLSPCVLPIVPGYLSVITGLDITADPDDTSSRRSIDIARDTGLFVAGFGAVFVALGLSASALGSVLFDNQLALTRVAGVMVVLMGAFVLVQLWATDPRLGREVRFHPELGRFGRAAPSIAGAAFGFGWTPCIGPVLGSILAIAAGTGSPAAGATLLATYAVGLGVPFLVTGLAFHRVRGALDVLKRHARSVTIVSGLSLIFFGLLLVLNRLIWVTTELQKALRAVGLEWIVNLG